MTKEEIQDILEELHLVRREILQPKAKKLFEAIMIIADERDKYKQMYEMEKALFIDADLKIERAIDYIENHSLYETEYDYDYEENSYLSGIDDETAKKDLLEILKGDNND